MKGEWQPIETAPKGDLLIYWPATSGRDGRNYLGAMMRVATAGSTPNRPPTHWMPLPEPPQ